MGSVVPQVFVVSSFPDVASISFFTNLLFRCNNLSVDPLLTSILFVSGAFFFDTAIRVVREPFMVYFEGSICFAPCYLLASQSNPFKHLYWIYLSG